jgi:hypothetical protein
VAELVYHGTSLREIAGLSWHQVRWLYFRDRDKYCRLVRPQDPSDPYNDWDEPAGTRVKNSAGFGEAFFKSTLRQAARRQIGRVIDGKVFRGWTEEDIDGHWQAYLLKNPSLAEHLGLSRPAPGMPARGTDDESYLYKSPRVNGLGVHPGPAY